MTFVVGGSMEKVNEKMIELSGCEKLILGCIYEYYRKNEKAPNLKDITAFFCCPSLAKFFIS